MPITKLPGVYYDEQVTYELTGEGSKIPVIIGLTGNTGSATYKVDGTVVRKYTSWEDVNKPCNATNPGICPAPTEEVPDPTYNEETIKTTNNQLARFLYQFFEEARLQVNSDLGVPYVYVIDVGAGTSKDAWVAALKTAKSKLDATIEIYVGADTISNYSLKDFLDGAYNLIKKGTTELDLRCAFTTKGFANPDNVSDADLIALTNESTGNQYSRIGICEPLLFGKTLARICCTPSNTEPGYYQYRVEPGTFKDRTKAEMLALQNAGIIFNRDEHINSDVYPKINLCTSTSFAATTRPADALFHARFNADSLLREVFAACYTQIKANESATNIAYLQTRINKIVNDKVSAEEMIKFDEKTMQGTKLIVSPSDADPYSLIISGQMHPQKCTVAIEVEATVKI